MNRKNIEQFDGYESKVIGWFDLDRATEICTQRQGDWHGRKLYSTASGKLVCYNWSSVQGERDTYSPISAWDAVALMIAEGVEEIPVQCLKVLAEKEW